MFVKEGEQWKVVQYNLHFPVLNDLAKLITKVAKEYRTKRE